MERGDKYRFESFPGLAEALIEKVLEVVPLFYKANWDIRYLEDGRMSSTNTIDGLNGTTDILQKIAALPKLSVDDSIQTAEFSDSLLQVNEAALTLRNMIMLDDNAFYVSDLYPLRDFLSIALNLPQVDFLVELKHYALDIAEQLTRYWHFDETDPLYLSLLSQLQSQDRGAILVALRSINRTSMNLEENNLLKGIPVPALQNVMDWTLLNDEEMAHACLDFLYQYTAVVDNVDFMISEVQVEPLVNQLTRLLMHNVKVFEREIPIGPEEILRAPAQIAPLPQDLYAQILRLDEPERSSQWLRCLFEEDPDESITQIALWQAYQVQFTPAQNEGGRHLLPAADFIKNVSSTFYDKAVAQVQAGPIQKFIIRGIRHRTKPVDFNGEEYSKCLWQIAPGAPHPGGVFHMSPEDMYRHILKDHLGEAPRNDGKFENVEARYTCHWDRCNRFNATPATNLAMIARHIKVHTPPAPSAAQNGEYAGPPAKKRKTSYRISPKKQSFSLYHTQVDEHNVAAGIPLSAVLVLRNLARNLSKTEAEENALKDEGGVSWVDRLFKPVEPRLYDIMAHNKSLVSFLILLMMRNQTDFRIGPLFDGLA
jgi:chromatin structure-remodeling complex subunit RSC9